MPRELEKKTTQDGLAQLMYEVTLVAAQVVWTGLSRVFLIGARVLEDPTLVLMKPFITTFEVLTSYISYGTRITITTKWWWVLLQATYQIQCHQMILTQDIPWCQTDKARTVSWHHCTKQQSCILEQTAWEVVVWHATELQSVHCFVGRTEDYFLSLKRVFVI